MILFRLYRSITRYISIETYVKITKASTIGTGLWALIVYNLHLPFPRSVFIIFFIFSTSLLFLTRYTARSFLTQQKENAKHAVLIYGTSQEAIEINNILKGSQSILSKGYISNDSDDTKTMIAELPVYTLKDIEKVISKKNIREILITHSDQSKNKLKLIVKELDKHHGIIRKLPNIKDLATGTIKLSQIQKIDIDDLLGRDTIKPNQYLLKACIQNKAVLVTGAGGSIGSELCRQIICLNPKKIILLEQSEYFLYEIEREIYDIKSSTNLNVDISTYMGSVGDESLVKHVFRNENVDTVYHAAANKHVPLVEHNP